MNKILLTLIFFAITLGGLSSCKKDLPIMPDPVYTGPPVYAGMYTSDYYYYEFPSPESIEIAWDTVYHYGYGEQALDLYGDGLTELVLWMSLDDTSVTSVDEGAGFHLFTKPGIRVALCAERVCEHGTCGDKLFVDTLSYGERIDTKNYPEILLSYTGNGRNYTMWSWWVHDAGSPSNGAWYYTSGIRYAAFRTEAFKHGWIKFDITDPEDPTILSFAVQK